VVGLGGCGRYDGPTSQVCCAYDIRNQDENNEIRQAAEGVALEASTFVRSTVIRIVRADRHRISPGLHRLGMHPIGEPSSDTGYAAAPLSDDWTEEAMPTLHEDIELDADKLKRFLPLSISSSKIKIKPKETASITARPQEAFRPYRIVIGGNPDHWAVGDIKIGRRSQFNGDGDLPGSAFSSSAPSVPMDVVPAGGNLTIVVTYIGPAEGGEEFSAAAFGELGWSDPGSKARLQARPWVYLPIECGGQKIAVGVDSTILTRPSDPFRPGRIVICGDASRWIVDDVLVGNRSQTANAGPMPGTAFAISGCEFRMDTVQTAMELKLRVRYVGPVEGGEPFVAYAVGPIASCGLPV
jgi:hypothetical protein